MSLKAMIWVMERAPIESPAEGMVLYALADRAHDDGTAAWPSMQWIADRACCSRQTVRRHLRALEKRGLIYRGDQRHVDHLRPDKRPVVWNLNLGADRNAGVQSDTPTRAGYQNEPSGVSNPTERGITRDTQTVLNPPMNQGGETEVEVTGTRPSPPASPSSAPSTVPSPPAPAGATPDTWCTPDHPRCREHAHIPPGEEVPPCRQCGNVRSWFIEQHRATVEDHHTAIRECPLCDDRGLIDTTDTAGRPVAVKCDHTAPPGVVPGPEHHVVAASPETRAQALQRFRRAG